jgi:hypothetical protein
MLRKTNEAEARLWPHISLEKWHCGEAQPLEQVRMSVASTRGRGVRVSLTVAF